MRGKKNSGMISSLAQPASFISIGQVIFVSRIQIKSEQKFIHDIVIMFANSSSIQAYDMLHL